jgi:hypothetical protein
MKSLSLAAIKTAGISMCLLLALVIFPSATRAQGSNEYNVKAMFVLNFIKYIEWPADPSPGFKIGVAGESGIYDALLNMTKNRQESKKIIVEKVEENSTDNYNIIIIPREDKKKSDEWVKKYYGKGVLIITDELKRSDLGAINLVTVDNKIRFEIYNSQARLMGIKISSRLSDLAITVYP